MQRNKTFSLRITTFRTGARAAACGFRTAGVVFPENRLGLAIAFKIAFEEGDFSETAPEAAEQGGVDRIFRRSECVEDHLTSAAGLDQAGAPEIGEMARDLRLRDLQNALELAHAVLPLCQEIQQSHPCRIGKRFK